MSMLNERLANAIDKYFGDCVNVNIDSAKNDSIRFIFNIIESEYGDSIDIDEGIGYIDYIFNLAAICRERQKITKEISANFGCYNLIDIRRCIDKCNYCKNKSYIKMLLLIILTGGNGYGKINRL